MSDSIARRFNCLARTRVISFVLFAFLAFLTLPLFGQADRSVFTPDVRFANSGSTAAQSAFLHGLTQLHNFEYQTAAEDFRRAQAIDPNFAMAYWGEAMTYNHPVWYQQQRPPAQAILKKLGDTEEARLAKCGTERERDYMRAVDIQYFGDGTKYERDFKYADAMAKLYWKYPDDVDAGAFYALALLGTAHYGRDFAIYMRALAVLEPLFFAHPNHPGVNHYLIHSVDDPVHAPLGLAAARNYSKIALDAPHAQHMTSHIFVALGMWDDVIEANQTAVRLQNEQNTVRGLPAESCGHYVSWLEYGYLQERRMRDAKTVLTKCRDAALAAAERKDQDAFADIDDCAAMRSRYLLDSEEWDGDVAHWPSLPDDHDNPELSATLAFVESFAAIRRGDSKAAKNAYAELVAVNKAENARPLAPGATPSPEMKRLAILQQQLEALLAATEGNSDRAVGKLRQAAEAEQALPVEFGPPFIEKPTEELLGEVLLSAGRAGEAKAAFEASLGSAPERTQSLLGLSRAFEASGDNSTAAAILDKLQRIWHEADHVRN
jgi:tetratricopeptide (TPR) repeat protein